MSPQRDKVKMQRCRLSDPNPPNNRLGISDWGLMVRIFSQFSQIHGSPTLRTLESPGRPREPDCRAPGHWFRGLRWALKSYISSQSSPMLLPLLVQSLEPQQGWGKSQGFTSWNMIQNPHHPCFSLRKEDILAWSLKSCNLMADFINRLTTCKWQKHRNMPAACCISFIIPMETPCDLATGYIQGHLLGDRWNSVLESCSEVPV